MRLIIYNLLVNRVPGIKNRYHKMHITNSKTHKLLSWIYLLWLNFAYYVLQFRWLGSTEETKIFEQKKLCTNSPESDLIKHLSVDKMIKKLSEYDVISFDIFDTLVFRPFSNPTDLFYIVGQKLGYMDFKRIRIECEKIAREKKYQAERTYEVSIVDIWNELELQTGISASNGVELEVSTELALCYSNEYMHRIYETLVQLGKNIVITSDMYLPADFLQRILDKCGYSGYDYLYVSCDEKKSKSNGELFQLVLKDVKNNYGSTAKIIHIGDNPNSDYGQPIKMGIEAHHYKNVNINSSKYRTYDISPIIGGAYRGIVNNRIYSGLVEMSLNQEFGFIYGGIFILGYSNYIYEYCMRHNIEKIIFLSRDGAIIKKVFDYLYPECNTEYAYISRFASAKWSAKYMKYDYFRKMIRHKINSGKSLEKILQEMELGFLIKDLNRYGLTPQENLTVSNQSSFEEFMNDNWNLVIDLFKPESDLAKKYYEKLIGDATSAAIVDIGWAGSSFVALKTLFETEWHINCKLTGIVAGTNTVFSSEPDMSDSFILDGSLVPYMYSSSQNRDIWKKHNPNLGYNLYFELLTSSSAPSFRGFKQENEEIRPVFSEAESNATDVDEIWDGVITFVKDYKTHFSNYPYMFNISGRDAYAPMLLAESKNERYLRKVYKEFDLTVGVE